MTTTAKTFTITNNDGLFEIRNEAGYFIDRSWSLEGAKAICREVYSARYTFNR